MTDDRDQHIKAGDIVEVLYVDRSRGAELWMHRGEVVGFGHTRVQVRFPSRPITRYPIGPECLRVVAPTP